MNTRVHRRTQPDANPLGVALTFHLVNWDDRSSIVSTLVPAGTHPPMLYQCGVTPHCHDYGELVLILQGSITHVTDSGDQPWHAGTLAFVHPDLMHSFIPVENEVCELLNFAFPYDYVAQLENFLGDPFGLKSYSGALCQFLIMTPAERNTLAQRFLWFHAHQFDGGSETASLLRGMLTELFCKQFIAPQLTPKPQLPTWIENLLSSFQHPQNVIEGLSALKRLAPCSQGYLCKSFKKHLGKSPTEYINEQRSYMAAQLLAATTTKISVIASSVGCRSEAHFYTIFQSTYGCTPNKYRQELLLNG